MKMKQLLSINKKLFICIVLFSSCYSATYADDNAKSICFDFQETALENALNYLIKECQIQIAYQDEHVKGITVSASCEDCTIEETLDKLLIKTPLSWQKLRQQYIISSSKSKKKIQSGKNIIKGFVRDQSNGETLPNANIIIEGTLLGDAADENGYYLITAIPDGRFTIKAMMMGYKIHKTMIKVADGKTITLDFNLEQSVLEGEIIIKTAEREQFERQIEPSKIQITRRDIEATPAFVEADLFRSIQMLPGVVAQSDFSSALYIRGGNPSENIILLDDVRIYNPYHIGGVFSTFNTDAIKSVDVLLGGFPPRYGNAISSVISVTNKDGNSKEFEGKGSISLLSSKLVLESPIPNGSILLSGRRTYFDFIYNNFIVQHTSDPESGVPYYFYDFHGKLNYSLSPNNKITLSGFYGDDILAEEEDRDEWDTATQTQRVVGKDITDIKFGNFTTSVKWQYIFNPKMFSEFVLAKSRFRVGMNGDYGDEYIDATDIINDYSVKGDLTYFVSEKHEVKFGLDYQNLHFKLFLDINNIKLIDYKRQANFYSAYLQDDWKISPLLNLQAGTRITYYNLGDYIRFDPRINARYRLLHNLNLKGSMGVFHQYFYTFNPEDIDMLNYVRLIDLWFPIDERYKPIRATHYIAGLEYLINNEYLFSIEGYYKDYNHLMDLNELGDKGQEDDFLTGWGHATGLEFLLRKQHGNLTGWIGYALAFTERTIQTPRASNFLNNENIDVEYSTYPPSHDRRHSLTAVISYKITEGWKINYRATYCSGLPETPTLGWRNLYGLEDDNVVVESYRVPVKAPKNSKQLPAYIRLDASLMWRYQFKKWSIQPYLQIINLTNHKNILLYNYELDRGENPNGYMAPAQRRGMAMFPFLPTIGVNFQF